MKQVLLIGGPADGKRVDVIDELATIYMYQYPEYMVQFSQQFDQDLTQEYLVYRIEKLAGASEIFWLGLYDDLTADEALEMLIEGYRK